MNDADVRKHNQVSWDKQVAESNRWTVPVDGETIQRARTGDFSIVLTPTKPVPKDWFPPLTGTPTLCLASAGGQQAPILAAAGARVTLLDNSPGQLGQDRLVADREGLKMEFMEGDMADLSIIGDDTFDFIFHPCSNVFVPKILPVWRECYRVLRSGGTLLTGFVNPLRFIFEDERKENGNLNVCYKLPYSDLNHLQETHIKKSIEDGFALEFGHTLNDQIGGQLKAGFLLSGFYEDRYHAADEDPLSNFLDTFIATRAIKP
ncbi:class I SAM-dependent methyltransferase [Rhodopirellula bahusiensis]|uniref:class I SAM-dependent methyltransferase n=1 Tax=Rhodopirellula bahusiensis TaxID=2014065 RepID=UPI003265643F